MNAKELDKIAKETARYWSNNCIDELFMDYCADSLCSQDFNDDDINKILDIIEEKYLDIE